MSSSSSTPLLANKRHIPDIIPEKDAYEMAMRSRVRVTAGDSRGCLTDSGLEAEVFEFEVFFLSRLRRGVSSLVISSVTPVVSTAGVAGTAGVPVVGEGGAVSGMDSAASLRLRENSTICVYRFSKVSFTYKRWRVT